jgi:hypothetical protein
MQRGAPHPRLSRPVPRSRLSHALASERGGGGRGTALWPQPCRCRMAVWHGILTSHTNTTRSAAHGPGHTARLEAAAVTVCGTCSALGTGTRTRTRQRPVPRSKDGRHVFIYLVMVPNRARLLVGRRDVISAQAPRRRRGCDMANCCQQKKECCDTDLRPAGSDSNSNSSSSSTRRAAAKRTLSHRAEDGERWYTRRSD